MVLLKRILVVLLFLAVLLRVNGQEQLGLRIENYSGVNSVLLNPANNVTSQFKWDVNLVGAGVFVENNYAFIRQANLFRVLNNLDNIESVSDISDPAQPSNNSLILDYDDNSRDKNVATFIQVTGPSFMVKLESGHTFGLFTNFRVAASSQRIPAALGYYAYRREPHFETFEIGAGKVAGMAWGELGVNYAYQKQTYNGSFGIGVNLKFLRAYEGFYLHSGEDVQLTKYTNDTISLSNANIEYGFTDSNLNVEDNGVRLTDNGGGLAFDLGVVYTIDGYEGNYQWKFGLSLLDIGRLNFKRNAQKHMLSTNSAFTIPTTEYRSLDDPEEVDEYVQLLSYHVLGDPSASLAADKFGVWLPAAFSLQADYAFTSKVFFNATLVQRMPFGKAAVARGNMLALTPRYEHRWYGAALPLTLYNWQQFHVGLAIRLAFLTIGTDNLGSMLGRSDFTGTDFYIALKINPFKLNWFGGGNQKRKKGKTIGCYKF